MPKEIIIGSSVLDEAAVRAQLENGRWERVDGVTFTGAPAEITHKQEFHKDGIDYVAVGGPGETTVVFTTSRLDALATNHARSQGLRIVDQNGDDVATRGVLRAPHATRASERNQSLQLQRDRALALA